ncbi:hypothetical protein BP6252_14067 [Coleophoma cylindrospora]|uniref:N-acetyltransferase domain-containing protein n=1 Tax=Coleophoma cylindrospora TaxID=1849047 RepID=A0A3D8Q5H1_9HELO|nr:hypothetical protein BP6252_14067 [Coleophoma cylindrospora]
METLSLLPCVPADAAEIFAGQRLSFGSPREPFFDVLFPPTEGEEKGVQRTIDWWVEDESAKYMKVVDETGKIISAAKWCIYETALTREQMDEKITCDWHENEDTNKWSSHIINWIHDHRLSKTKGARCCVLDILSTHPEHQRRGAGSLLVKWGTDIADAMGVPAYIEGSIYARRLYEQNGFVASSVDLITIPVPEIWQKRDEIKFLWFERAPKTE